MKRWWSLLVTVLLGMNLIAGPGMAASKRDDPPQQIMKPNKDGGSKAKAEAVNKAQTDAENFRDSKKAAESDIQNAEDKAKQSTEGVKAIQKQNKQAVEGTKNVK